MQHTIVGEQIQKFRKEARLTQKELGEAIGVSSSAVSQWESGGTPDVSLLPAIADKLGVTIDALFGREGGDARDMTDAITAWLRSQPREKRLEHLTRLIWHLSIFALSKLEVPKMSFLKTCEQDLWNEGKQLMKSIFSMDNGYIFAVPAEDMSFMCIFPEPEEGYERFFDDNERYRELFGALSIPGTLELLRFLCRKKENFYVASATAKHIGRTADETGVLFEKLTDIGILQKIELELEDAVVPAYMLPNTADLIPLLYFARWIRHSSYYINIPRTRPCLAIKEGSKHEKK